MKGRDSGNPSRSARLSRYAAVLKLDDKHRSALISSAVTENMEVGNYGYAAGQLTNLITQSVGSASTSYMSKLQDQLNECDRKGTRDKDIPQDEDTATFPDIIASAGRPAELDSILQPMMAS